MNRITQQKGPEHRAMDGESRDARGPAPTLDGAALPLCAFVLALGALIFAVSVSGGA